MGFKRRDALAGDWKLWLVDNLSRGVAPARLTEILRERGVPPALAARAVDDVSRSELRDVAQSLGNLVRAHEMLARLERERARQSPRPGHVRRVHTIDADEFYAEHWARGRPLVLTGLTAEWPARAWTPANLAARFGDVELEVCLGREADVEPDRRWKQHRQRMTLDALVRAVEDAGESNDIYLIAHNRALSAPGLAALREDIRPDPALFDPESAAMSLWIGPAGTRTPLHHDTTNIAFNQLYGRKRFRLAPPGEVRLWAGARGFYAGRALDDFEDADVHEVVLEPGESLFIPAGWWHDVRALDVSISLSLMGFRRPNDLSWLHPAAVANRSRAID